MNFSDHSIETYMKPEKLRKTFEENEIELEIVKSSFPTDFDVETIGSTEKQKKRFAYELKLENVKAKGWEQLLLDDRKKEDELKQKVRNFEMQSALGKVLERRNFWKARFKWEQEQVSEIPEESMMFEPGDSDKEEISLNQEEDEIIVKKTKQTKVSASDKKLTFIKPDYNMWQRSVNHVEASHSYTAAGGVIKRLPKSFDWLLNFASNVLSQCPLNLYFQLLCLEYQFMSYFQPFELMEDVVLRQYDIREIRIRGGKNSKLEQIW